MSGTPDSVTVRQLDPADEATLAEFVAFGNEHRPARQRSLRERQELFGIVRDVLLLDASDGHGARATCIATTTDMDQGQRVHLETALAPASEWLLDLLLDAVGAWEPGHGTGGAVAHLPDPDAAEVAAWLRAGFEPAGMRVAWLREVTAGEVVSVPAIDGLRMTLLDREPKLIHAAHACWCSAYTDIPDDNIGTTPPGFDAWIDEVREADGSIPGLFLAVDGRTGEVAAVARLRLHEAPPGQAGHQFTGVAPAWRGRGVARLLKTTMINWAGANGVRQLRASNNERNDAMLHLNRALGYREVGAITMLRRDG